MIDVATLLFLLFATPVACSLPIAFAWVYRPGAEWARKLPILSVFGLFVSLCVALFILFYIPNGRFVYPWLPDYNINFVFIFDYLSKYMERNKWATRRVLHYTVHLLCDRIPLIFSSSC